MKLLALLNQFLTSIINAHELSIEETGRRKLLLIFFSMIIPLDIVYGILNIVSGSFIIGVMDLVLAVVMSFFIFLLRYLKNCRPLYITIIVIYAMALIYFIQTGVAGGYGSIWIMFLPIISLFLLGKKGASIVIIIFSTIILVFLFNPELCQSGFSYSPEFLLRLIPTYFMVVVFTYSYEDVREKYKLAMEGEQQKLLLEKEKLAETNRLLQDEMRMKEFAELELRKHRDHLEEIVAERTLEIKESEKRYRLMADNINDVIWTTDMKLKFTFVSPSVFRIYGYTSDEINSIPRENWITEESFSSMIRSFKDMIKLDKQGNHNPDKYFILQMEHIKKNGAHFPVELKVSFIRDEDLNPLGFVGITRDISDRIEVEQEKEKIKDQLAQSQKMESLGTLVGGLAHDFNNFLTGIIGSFNIIMLALKKEKLERRDYIEKHLNLGIESSKRSAGLISQLLVLSRKHEITLAPLDLKNSINSIYELCRNSFPKSIELDFRAEDTPLLIIGNIVQVEQVLLNFCINASHAMTIMRKPGDKEGGKLTVTAERVHSDYIMKESFSEEAGAVESWIMIRISDTGVGIPAGLMQKIFEPFFSTKSKNMSSGLGLAISYNIIKKHGGLVRAYSEPDKGTCFSIYFPVYSDIREVRRESSPEIIYGSGTVLIIDDEPVILKIAEGFLTECGYRVIKAEGADKGLEQFRKHHEDISAVLIDLSMPGKTGIEVFSEMQKIKPDVKAVLSSGMLDNDIMEKALKMGVMKFLKKPYLAVELSMIINSVISGEK